MNGDRYPKRTSARGAPTGREKEEDQDLDLRVLIDELGSIVHLIVNDHEQVLLGIVLGNILESILLVGHFERWRYFLR